MKELLKIRLKGVMLAHLCNIYEGIHSEYVPENNHELLLKGHITELKDKLCQMDDRNQQNNTLSFSGTELLAFVQLWQSAPMPLKPIEAQVIQFIFNKLDVKRHDKQLPIKRRELLKQKEF